MIKMFIYDSIFMKLNICLYQKRFKNEDNIANSIFSISCTNIINILINKDKFISKSFGANLSLDLKDNQTQYLMLSKKFMKGLSLIFLRILQRI